MMLRSPECRRNWNNEKCETRRSRGMENQERRGRDEETKRRTCGDLHTAPPRRRSPGPTTEDATIEQGGTDRNEAERCGAEQQPQGSAWLLLLIAGRPNRGPIKRKRIQLNGSGLPGRIAALHLSHVLAFLLSPPFRKPNLSLLGGRERERERDGHGGGASPSAGAGSRRGASRCVRHPEVGQRSSFSISARWVPPSVDLVPQSALFPFCFVCVFVSAGWSSSLWNGGVWGEGRRRSRRRLRMRRWHWVWTPRTR